MPILRTVPSIRIINGHTIETSECAILSECEYITIVKSKNKIKN